MEGGDVISGLVSIYVEARDMVAELEASLKNAKATRDAAEEKLAQAMIFRGVRAQKMMDGSQVFLQAEVLVSRESGVPAEAVCAALRKEGYGALVHETYSPQTIRALLREARQDHDGAAVDGLAASLPESLRGLVRVMTRTRVRVRGKPGAAEDRDHGEDTLNMEPTAQGARNDA